MIKNDKESNLLASFNEYHIMELKNDVDKIKKILGLPIYNYPDPKCFNTNYYTTVSGNYLLATINDDFENVSKYTSTERDLIYKNIESLKFKFIFKNEDTLKIELDDYDSIERFINKEKFINNFKELDGKFRHKAVLVIYKKL